MEVGLIRKKVIIANWKMNKILAEAEEFLQEFLPLIQDVDQVEMAICPPFTCLDRMQQKLVDTKVFLGGQNLFYEKSGAFTGEIAADMLKDTGCKYVLIGHSERRHILAEDDDVIKRKLQVAIEAGLIPILCVGETLAERESKQAIPIVKAQLASLQGIKPPIIIAYEPVWAIGTGINASADDAQEMCAIIRQELKAIYDESTAQATIILYGGSVKEENLAGFLNMPDLDGALVGGASLNPLSLANLVRIGENIG